MFNNYKKDILNHKNIFVFFYMIIVIILIFLISKNFSKKEEFKKVEKINYEYEKQESLKKLNEKDTDGDGLEDWQEHLYGTNIDLIDTDGDGVSDFEEVKLNRNPIVFGNGNIDNIKKVESIKVGVAGIKEQRDNFKNYKESLRLKEKRKFELFLKKEKNTLTFNEKKEYKKIINNKNIIKKDLNTIAKHIIKFDSEIDINKTNDFKVFFSILSGNKNNEKINKNQLDYIKKVANLDLNISAELNSLNIKNKDIDNFRIRLSKTYNDIGKSLISLLSKYSSKNSNIEIKDDMKKYGDSVSELVQIRQYMHLFIDSKDIKFAGYDEGKIFYYSL